ncbi:hypothetical protein [Allopontixanthobacter confluentis]|nr:hypothetical protein [Allopontixanthobacter confluentis]
MAKPLHNMESCSILQRMNEQRIEQAVQRIEAALGRIAQLAENKVSAPVQAPPPTSVSGLVVKHEALRDTVASSLKEIDALLERLEK